MLVKQLLDDQHAAGYLTEEEEDGDDSVQKQVEAVEDQESRLLKKRRTS